MSVKTPPLQLDINSTYSATLEVTNGAGLTRLVGTSFTLPIGRAEYPGTVDVLNNYGQAENESGLLVELETVGSSEDYVCLIETDTLSVEFPAPPPDTLSIDSDR